MRNTLGVCCENEPRLCENSRRPQFFSRFSLQDSGRLFFLALLTRGVDLGIWFALAQVAVDRQVGSSLMAILKPGHGNAFATGITYNPSHCATLRWKYFIHHH